MNIERLRLFRDVAERGSIAATARAADIDPSAISRAIAALERELGLRLLQRTTRKLSLTEAGSIYLAAIAEHLDGLSEAHAAALDVVEEPRGLLRVTASTSFGQTVIAPMIPSFLEAHSGIQLDLLLTDQLVDLVADRIDVAFRLGPRPTGDLVAGRLSGVRRRVVASPAYVARHGVPSHPADLEDAPCLLSVMERRGAIWSFQRNGETVDVRISGRVATSNTVVLRMLAVEGAGPTLLAEWVIANDLAAGRLVALLPDWEGFVAHGESGVWVAYPSRRHLPLKARRFIEHVRRWGMS